MKTLLTLCALITALLFIHPAAHAQNSTSDSLMRMQRGKQMKMSPLEQKKQQRNYYKRTLRLDSVKAEQVAKVQEDYKSGMKAVGADQGLSQEARKARISALMEEKNIKLESLLDGEQQKRMIPPGEPRGNKGAVRQDKKKNQTF